MQPHAKKITLSMELTVTSWRFTMHILLYQDETLTLDLPALVEGLNSRFSRCSFKLGGSPVILPGKFVSWPKTYNQLPIPLKRAVRDSRVRLGIVITAKRYDNNYFYDTNQKAVILSLAEWSNLTTLSVNNGIAYFIAKLLAEEVGAGHDHQRSQGCINDFRVDKSAVHFGMLGASICVSCIDRFQRHEPRRTERVILADIKKLLNEISAASRLNFDLLEYWKSNRNCVFDVFLCHNSRDKEAIRSLARRLKAKGLRAWLDEEQIRPGQQWQLVLEEQIANIGAAAICIGNGGFGPWQNLEIRAFLDQMVRRARPIIPVLLETCSTTPILPPFLSQLMWVDLRKKRPDPLNQLVWGITKRQKDTLP